MKHLAFVLSAVILMAGSAFSQGRLSKDGDPGNPDRPQGPAVAAHFPSTNATVASKPMRLIASGATIEDFEVNPDDININADQKYRAFSTLSLNIPADPSRTFGSARPLRASGNRCPRIRRC